MWINMGKAYYSYLKNYFTNFDLDTLIPNANKLVKDIKGEVSNAVDLHSLKSFDKQQGET